MLLLFKCIITVSSDLTDILRAHGSDKATHHHYDEIYAPLFASLRDAPINFLEIGVEDGHSMTAWSEYFTHPTANITGLAYKNRLQERLTDKRLSIVYGDQNSSPVQDVLIRKGNYTIIIDDGSHVPSHQWNTFVRLWPFLKQNGLYIIEDIETSYWSPKSKIYGYSLSSETSVIEKFTKLIDSGVNAEFLTGVDKSDIESISFHKNCIILRKTRFHKSRVYRHKHKLIKFQPK